MTDSAGKTPVELAANIVSAYLSNNPTQASEIPNLISQVHAALMRVSSGRPETPLDPAKPAVSVKKSMTPEYLICLEDGKRFKSLKRHLRTQYNMTPEQYRDKWGLPPDYPMVAPNYAVARSQLAKKMGLWQQGRERKGERVRPAGAETEVAPPRHSAAASSASRASERMRSTMERRPLERCGVRCSRNPNSSKTAIASVARICCGVRPEYSVSRIAIRPRTMWASLSPKYFRRGSSLPLRSICLDSQTWLTQPFTLFWAECSASGIGSSVRPSSM